MTTSSIILNIISHVASLVLIKVLVLVLLIVIIYDSLLHYNVVTVLISIDQFIYNIHIYLYIK